MGSWARWRVDDDSDIKQYLTCCILQKPYGHNEEVKIRCKSSGSHKTGLVRVTMKKFFFVGGCGWCRNKIKKRSQGILLCRPHSVGSPLSASNMIWTNENFMSWKISPMSIIDSVRLTSALEMLRDWDTFPNLGSNVTQNILEKRWNSSSLIINQLSVW